jgi:putative MATE family efflux protein
MLKMKADSLLPLRDKCVPLQPQMDIKKQVLGMTGQNTPTALGTENIGKLLMQYAVPAIIAMTASSLYNMVDSIFIGHGVGTMAISGLALTFPLMNLAAAFGSLVGVGASTLISVKLGQKDYDTAQRVLGNVFVLNILLGVAFTVVVLAFLDPILYFFGGSDQTIGYARDYMQIILLGNAITHLYLGLNAVLRSSGHPQKAMYATIATVVINTILDPVFIYGFGWGIRGAAIATIVAQIISLAWQFKLFSNRDELLHFHRGIFRLKRKIVLDSLAIGMSPFLMNLAACFIVILINQGLKEHGGDLAIGAFGIVNRLVFIIVMVVMGLNQGMQPIAGYNFGARQYKRVDRVLKLTIVYATAVTTFGFVVGMLVPDLVVSIFTSDQELIDISARGLRIVVMFFPIIGFQMVTSNFFQSIGMAGKAIFLSLTRQMLVLLPCLIILPRFFGVAGVWYSMPVSDLIASLIAAVMLVGQFRKFKRAEG